MPANRIPASPWLVWFVLYGLLSGIIYARPALGRSPPVALGALGSHVTNRPVGPAAVGSALGLASLRHGVLLTLGWVFGLTLYVILTVTFRVMLAATTGSLRLGMNGDDLSSNAVENAPQDGVPPPWMITALP